MKSSIKYLALLLPFVFSCARENTVAETTAAATETVGQEQAVADAQQLSVPFDSLVNDCNALFAEWQRLNKLKAGYFAEVVLARALANPDLTDSNKDFLIALDAYLNRSASDLTATLVPEQVLFPIFKLNEKELAVFGFEAHDTSSTTDEDISAEHKLLTDYSRTSTAKTDSLNTVMFYPDLAKTMFRKMDQSFYAFTSERKIPAQLTNFGRYTGECSSYYNYLIDERPFGSNGKPLFGSRFNLDLIFENHPEADLQLQSQFNKECDDCPSSMDLARTFASLKGVEDLFFIYADNFSLTNPLKTPLRGLMMRMDDKMVFLWYEEVDMVGCSCI